jgi:MinD-like ATPase involved in chromosome partitioning or flagellar assembly
VGLTHDKVESTLGMTIAAAIPTSHQVAHATNAGEPIVLAQPRHQVSQAIKKLASTIAAASPGHSSTAPDSAPAGGQRRSLLRRGVR